MHSHIDNNEDKKQNKNVTRITAIHLTDVPAAVVFWEPVDLVTLLHIFCYPPITLSLVLKKKQGQKCHKGNKELQVFIEHITMLCSFVLFVFVSRFSWAVK